MTAKQMMADESMHDNDDPYDQNGQTARGRELNDTYANFDNSDSDDDIKDSEQMYMKNVARKDAEKPDTENDTKERNEAEKDSEMI